MATRFVVLVPLLVAMALCLVMEAKSDCGSGTGCFYVEVASTENIGRKLLVSSEAVFKGYRPMSLDTVSWELRKVPSGPDPLHHNRSPKKPQTP